MNKNDRQLKIKDIINNENISNQHELINALEYYYNMHVAQTTISRDIRDMNIIKFKTKSNSFKYYVYNPKNNSKERLNNVIINTVTSVNRIQFLNIVHTLSNEANRLAAIIDNINMKNVVGTLAGHDTIILFSIDNNNAANVERYIKSILKKVQD